MSWNVFENGTITIYQGSGAAQIEGAHFDLDTANKETYEKHLLDFVETIVGL